MSQIKGKLVNIKDRINVKYTLVVLAMMVLLYYGHSRILNEALIPAVNYLHGLPVIGTLIDWLMLYGAAETWNWHTISAVVIITIPVGIFCYWWGRSSIEVVELNEPSAASPPATVDKQAETATSTAKEAVKETAETVGDTKAELEAQIETIQKKIKELAE